MKHDIVSALRSLAPGAEWAISGGELLWHNGNGHDQPTEDAINAKIIELDTAEAMKLLREERDRRIAKTDWRASSDLTLSSEWLSRLDLPSTASPTLNDLYELDMSSVNWPIEP